MTTISGTSRLGEPVLDRLAVTLRAWTARHPRALRTAALLLRSCSWALAAVALVAAAFLPASRAALLALLWSQYALWQVFLLARSKSLTWQTCGRFFAVGALLAAPAAALTTGLLTALFSARPDAIGSAAGLAPFVEEGLKLAPLLLFVGGTSRARSLGVADLGLVGAAIGAGFACTEEAVRRVVALGSGPDFGSAAELGVPTWRVLALLPGQAGGAGRSFAGHVVLTAMVGLGVGFARRYRRLPGRAPLLLPGALLVLAVLDHAAWNGRAGLPRGLLVVHDVLGAGGIAAPLLLALLAGATLVDYRDLNRRRRWLVLLPGERRLDPLGELRLLVRLAPSGLPGTANLLSFLRRRRRLGYGLAQPDRYRDEALGALAARVAGHGRQLSSLLAPAARGAPAGAAALAAALALPLAAALLAATPPAGGGGGRGGSVALWFDRVGPWWGSLPWAGRAAAAATVVTLAGLAVGGWTAGLGVALVARDAADRRTDLVRFRRYPGYTALRWVETVTPAQLLAYGTSTLVDRLLRRVPPDDDARRRARRWPDGRLPGGLDVEAVFHGRLDTTDPWHPVPLGFSHRGSIGAAYHARIVPGSATAPAADGTYRAVVEVREETGRFGSHDGWVRAGAPTGFFPDAWSRARVLDEIRGALEEAVVEGGRWTGTSPSGLHLQGRLDPDGTVRTAHPYDARPPASAGVVG